MLIINANNQLSTDSLSIASNLTRLIYWLTLSKVQHPTNARPYHRYSTDTWPIFPQYLTIFSSPILDQHITQHHFKQFTLGPLFHCHVTDRHITNSALIGSDISCSSCRHCTWYRNLMNKKLLVGTLHDGKIIILAVLEYHSLCVKIQLGDRNLCRIFASQEEQKFPSWKASFEVKKVIRTTLNDRYFELDRPRSGHSLACWFHYLTGNSPGTSVLTNIELRKIQKRKQPIRIYCE